METLTLKEEPGEIASLKRSQLVKRTCEKFGRDAFAWVMKCSNEELREAITTGQLPAKANSQRDTTTTTTTTTQPGAAGDAAQIMAQLAAFVGANTKATVDSETVEAIIAERLLPVLDAITRLEEQGKATEAPAAKLSVKVGALPEVTVARQHYIFSRSFWRARQVACIATLSARLAVSKRQRARASQRLCSFPLKQRVFASKPPKRTCLDS